MTIVCGLIGTLTAPGIVPRAALERLLTDEDWKEAHAASTRRPGPRKRPAKNPVKHSNGDPS